MSSNRRAGAVALAAAVGFLLPAGCEEPKPPRGRTQGIPSPPDASPPKLITSTSTLKHTVVVPTLDTPIPEGKSTIWCGSFQLAWNGLKRDIAQGPVLVHNAESVAKRLNAASFSEADVEAADYFLATGKPADVIGRIDRELPLRFPGVEPPRFDDLPPGALMAFAFLKAGARYESEFRDNPVAFEFVDSANNHTQVHAFGLPPDENAGRDVPLARKQVQLLWMSESRFAVDLCRDSTPYQIVLAILKRKGTLAQLLADEEVERRHSTVGASYRLDEDNLLVPNMSWRLAHHFQELEGPDKTVGKPPGLVIGAAVQEIEFKLDRRGAQTASGAFVYYCDGGPKLLYFNRPFLIYLKKRTAAQPLFAMWVDSAELMQPWEATASNANPK
jgi:hypothetical protein